jgi:hypothetical protein
MSARRAQLGIRILVLVTLAVGLAAVGAPARASGLYGAGLFQLGDGKVPVGFSGMARIERAAGQKGPDWADLFDANGEPVARLHARFGGTWALFIADDVSRGTAPDDTALAGSPGLVRRGGVRPADDIGNVYGYQTADAKGSPKIFLGVERLNARDSFLEFELNQKRARLGQGGADSTWRVDGPRAPGDILVRLEFAGGGLVSTQLSAWNRGGWHPLARVDGEGCDEGEGICAIANASSVARGPWQTFDAAGIVNEIAPNRFIELGADVGTLLGGVPAYKSLRVRTPGDIAFGFIWGEN